MKFTSRQPPPIAMQLAPMIDILLLLLSFFIISWQFSRSETELNVSVPTAQEGAEPDRQRGEIIINVLPDGDHPRRRPHGGFIPTPRQTRRHRPAVQKPTRADPRRRQGGLPTHRRSHRHLPEGGNLEHFLCDPTPGSSGVIRLATTPELRTAPLILKRTLALPAPRRLPRVRPDPRGPRPVDPALTPDAANDFFLRGKNLYDSAQASTDLANRRDFYQRAAQIFAEYLTAFPNHPNAELAWWYLGNSYYQSGQIDDGKRCFSTLLNRYGKGKWAAAAAYTLAAEHYNKAEYAFAAPMFERYAANAAKPEERPRGNYFAGNCYRLLGRDREAIGSFKKVIEDPAGGLFAPQSKVALGHLALNAGKLQDALAQFEEVVAAPAPSKVRGEAALHAALTATKLDQTDLSDRYLALILRTPGMEDFRPDAQTALMGNHFAKKEYKEVIAVFRDSTIKAEGDKEAARLMIAARAYMRLKQPSEALGLFREVERLVKPETDLAFHASYYRLLCFFQIEGRHLPDQVDAFLQLYRKSRPRGLPHSHRPDDESGNPVLQQGNRRRRQGLQRDQRQRRQREKPPGPALSARLVPCRSG